MKSTKLKNISFVKNNLSVFPYLYLNLFKSFLINQKNTAQIKLFTYFVLFNCAYTTVYLDVYKIICLLVNSSHLEVCSMLMFEVYFINYCFCDAVIPKLKYHSSLTFTNSCGFFLSCAGM